MPEGVELLISKELIEPLVLNKKIIAAYSTPNSRYNCSKHGSNLLGLVYNDFINSLNVDDVKVNKVSVKGKFMYWEFSNKYVMFCTFGMTGQFSPTKGKHPCFVFEFSDGSEVYFNDPRHFGTIKFTNETDLKEKLSELGWDPFTPFKDKKDFILNTLKKSNKTICEDLMNQKIFCGVGNYIKSESLYLSKISPWKLSSTLVEDDIINLCEKIIMVMKDSYAHQGATISTYKDAYGAEGKYSSQFKVYSKKTDPLGYKVIKEKTLDGRTTHWCPEVQLFSK